MSALSEAQEAGGTTHKEAAGQSQSESDNDS